MCTRDEIYIKMSHAAQMAAEAVPEWRAKLTKEAEDTAKRFHANLLDLVDMIFAILNYAQQHGVTCSFNSGAVSGIAALMGQTPADIAKGFISTSNPVSALDAFIQRSYTYWPQVHAKDDGFLITNAQVLFAELPGNYVKEVSDVFNCRVRKADGKDQKTKYIIPGPHPTDEEVKKGGVEDRLAEWGLPFLVDDDPNSDHAHEWMREDVWQHIHALIRIAIRFIHQVRQKKTVSNNGKNIETYTVEFFPEISVRNAVATWNMKL